MSAAAKALDALEAARADGTSGFWDVREAGSYSGGVRKVDEYYVYSPSACDDVAIASDVVDPKKCKPSKANADLIVLSVNLSAPLAAVARAVADRPWWRNGYEDESGDEISRCEGCQADLDEDRGHSACHDIECRYLDSDRAIDALEAAAAEGGS